MSMLRNFATVGGATASSRVLGFVRDIFIAAALGTGPVADAYFVAQRLAQSLPPPVCRGRLRLGLRAAVHQEPQG